VTDHTGWRKPSSH